MKKLAPILVFGIPAVIFTLIAHKGFNSNQNSLAVVGMTFAVMSVLGCWLVIKEMNRKEKELAEKKQRKSLPIETVDRPIRSANEQEALKEIVEDLKKPLQLKIPEQDKPTEEKRKC